MSFLSVAFLFALPLMAAPLVLHFFDRRRNSVIEWGAMQFLTEASAKKTSARRLKQWLLLAMRILAIGLLVFALARPLAPTGLLGGDSQTETIFLIDNSLSMARSTDGVSHLDRAIDEVTHELAELPTGDPIRLMTTAPYPSWMVTGNSSGDDMDRNRLLQRLTETRVVGSSSDILSGLSIASQEAAASAVTARRIIVLTDGQSIDWQTQDEAGWTRLQQSLAESSLPVDVDLRRVDRSSSAAVSNLAVDELTVRRSIVGVGQTVTLSAQIHNYGDTDAADVSVTWTIDEAAGNSSDDATAEELGDEIEVVEAEQTVEALGSYQFGEPGHYRVSVRAEHEDDLPADNEASVVVEVVDRIPVVVVEEAFELAELQQDSYFVQTALGWLDGQSLGANSIYEPTVVSLQELATLDLRTQRVVVIPNLTQLEHDLLEQLADFVRDGGGLWLGLGSRTDIEWFNQKLFAEGSGPSPVALSRIADAGPREVDDSSDDEAVPPVKRPDVRIDPFRSSHPATRQLTDESQSDLGETLVERWFRFDGVEERQDVSILLSLDNGDPVAVENLFGRGRVIVQALPLRLQWSDLARKQSFVVMVRDLVDYLAAPRAVRFNLQPGEPIVWTVSESEDDLSEGPPTGMLTTPGGEVLELAATQDDQAFQFRTSRTRVPGTYQLEVGLAETAIPYHVHRDAAESRLEPLTSEATKQLTALTNPDRTETASEGVANQHADPVWPFLLAGLIVLLTAELVLSGILAKERFGVAGIAPHADLDNGVPLTDSFSQPVAASTAGTATSEATTASASSASSSIAGGR